MESSLISIESTLESELTSSELNYYNISPLRPYALDSEYIYLFNGDVYFRNLYWLEYTELDKKISEVINDYYNKGIIKDRQYKLTYDQGFELSHPNFYLNDDREVIYRR